MVEFEPWLSPDCHCSKWKIFSFASLKSHCLHDHSHNRKVFMSTNLLSQRNAAWRTHFQTDSFWCARKIAGFIAHHLSDCWETHLWKSLKYRWEWQRGSTKDIMSICIYNLISWRQREMQSSSQPNKHGSIRCNVIIRKRGDSLNPIWRYGAVLL